MDAKPSDIIKKEFGQFLKERRDTLHLTQGGVAAKAGLDRQQYYRIENGLSGTKRDTVIALAEALKLSAREALEKAGFAAEAEPNGLYSGLEKLSPERQELAKRQIKAIIDSLAEEENPDTDYIQD